MKRVFFGAVILAFIIPQLAFAAWWNPLSWKIFKKTDTTTQALESRVKELEKRLKEQATSTSVTTAKTTKQSQSASTTPVTKLNKTVSKSTQPTTVKLSKLNPLIDALIANYESDTTYAKTVLKSIDFYDDNFNKSRTFLSMLIDSETVPQFKQAWELVKTEYFDKQIKYNEEMRKLYIANVRYMEDSVTGLKKAKENNLHSIPVSQDQYLADYNDLNKLFDITDQLKKQMTSSYEGFSSKTEKFQSDVAFSMQLISAKEDAYMSSLINSYKSASELSRTSPSYEANVINYQPITYPQIQIPQITRCTMGTIGGGGIELVMNCSTSSF